MSKWNNIVEPEVGSATGKNEGGAFPIVEVGHGQDLGQPPDHQPLQLLKFEKISFLALIPAPARHSIPRSFRRNDTI